LRYKTILYLMGQRSPHMCCSVRLLMLTRFCLKRENLSVIGNKRESDSSVGIVTLNGLDCPGIESLWGGRDFPHLSRPAPGPTQSPIQWVPGLSRG